MTQLAERGDRVEIVAPSHDHADGAFDEDAVVERVLQLFGGTATLVREQRARQQRLHNRIERK